MPWWLPFFGKSKTNVVISREERILRAKTLERAKNYVELAIVSATRWKTRASEPSFTESARRHYENRVRDSLSRARDEVHISKEEIEVTLDNLASNPGDTPDLVLTNIQTILEKINERIREL